MDNISNNSGNNNIDVKSPLTYKNLVDYTEQVLLPAVGELIKDSAKKLDSRMVKIEEKMVTMEEKMVTKKYVDKLVTKEDQITKLLKNNEAELSASLGTRQRQQEKIDDHEVRIKALEGTPVQ